MVCSSTACQNTDLSHRALINRGVVLGDLVEGPAFLQGVAVGRPLKQVLVQTGVSPFASRRSSSW
jgi:hypothetical protein